MKASPYNQRTNELERICAMARDLHSDDLIDDDSNNYAPTELDWIIEANAWLDKATKEMQVALAQSEKQLEETKQMRLEIAKLTESANAIESEVKARKVNNRQHKTKKGFIADTWMLRKVKYGMSYS